MESNASRVNWLAWWLAALCSACGGTVFPAVSMTRPPNVPHAPRLAAPEAAKVASLTTVPANVDVVRATGTNSLNGRKIVLDTDGASQTRTILARYGDPVIVTAFLKRNSGGVIPLYEMPRLNAQSRAEVFQGGDRRKHDITISGTVSQLLPYAPVMNASELVILSLESSPYQGGDETTADPFATQEAALSAYKDKLNALRAQRERAVEENTQRYETAKQRFLQDGGKTDHPSFAQREAEFEQNLEAWQQFGKALAALMAQLPDVAALRASWLEEAKSRAVGRRTVRIGFKVVDLASQTLWGFGFIKSVGDDEQMAISKATTSLIETLFPESAAAPVGPLNDNPR